MRKNTITIEKKAQLSQNTMVQFLLKINTPYFILEGEFKTKK